MTFYVKKNDTAPSLRASLKDGGDQAIDLSDATVNFHMRKVGASTIKVDASAVVIGSSSDGIVQYNWTTADTDTAGTYQGEFEVTYSDGSVESFPNNGYILVEILDDIT